MWNLALVGILAGMLDNLWKRATRVELLLSLGGYLGLGGFMTWAAGQVTAIAAQGWAAVLLTGILVASALVIALGIGLLGVNAWLARRDQKGAPASWPEAPVSNAQAAESPEAASQSALLGMDVGHPKDRLYVGRVFVESAGLTSDYRLDYVVIGFNGNDVPLRIEGVRGYVRYGSSPTAADAELALLPQATIRDDNLTQILPRSEFMICMTQPVPGALAQQIESNIAAGNTAVFVMESLNIFLKVDALSEQIRVPIWSHLTYRRQEEASFHTGRIAHAVGNVIS